MHRGVAVSDVANKVKRCTVESSSESILYIQQHDLLISYKLVPVSTHVLVTMYTQVLNFLLVTVTCNI